MARDTGGAAAVIIAVSLAFAGTLAVAVVHSHRPTPVLAVYSNQHVRLANDPRDLVSDGRAP